MCVTLFFSLSSLWYADLRLCYPIGNLTRVQYEYDTSFFNGYYRKLSKAPPTPGDSGPKERAEVSIH